ncbi:MAG: thiol protease/hemagglutinin PrtT [Bacteroidales bacterium]|nr:thiol protease/hemagglutinin PrtT [Bacteroidales bacterium]
MMNKHINLLLLVVIALTFSVQAKEVDSLTAKKVAYNYFATISPKKSNISEATIVYQASIMKNDLPIPSFFAVNFGDEGFVIVSASDKVKPILAFSTESKFEVENIPEHIQFFLNGYSSEIQQIINDENFKDAKVNKEWNQFLQGNISTTKDGTVVVGPLLGNNKWAQTKYYNDKCPADATGDVAYGGHTAVGCGALVMGQIMRYWRFPTTGTGSHSYLCNSSMGNYGTLSANFGATTYRYENMSDRLTNTSHPDSCVDAISTLLYHCGVSVDMRYGPAASVVNSNYIVSALSTYFGYPATVQYTERGNMTTTTWMNRIKTELDARAPFMYGGSGNYGGHVWVCDGYRDDDYLHFNWGWGGQQNGYYAITSCSSYGFNNEHAIITGIRGPELPPPVSVEDYQNIDIKLYPNPTQDILHINATENEINEVLIYDIFGKEILHQNINNNNFDMDLSNYNSGTYILRIVTDNGVEIKKVVKY